MYCLLFCFVFTCNFAYEVHWFFPKYKFYLSFAFFPFLLKLNVILFKIITFSQYVLCITSSIVPCSLSELPLRRLLANLSEKSFKVIETK